jgi:hypothetical protein
MTRLDKQLVQVQRARLIAGEPVEAQNNMGRRVGFAGKEMVTPRARGTKARCAIAALGS